MHRPLPEPRCTPVAPSLLTFSLSHSLPLSLYIMYITYDGVPSGLCDTG